MLHINPTILVFSGISALPPKPIANKNNTDDGRKSEAAAFNTESTKDKACKEDKVDTELSETQAGD